MNSSIKILICSAGILCISLCHAESHLFSKPSDWNPSTNLTENNGVLSAKGSQTILTSKRIAVDPAKTYRLKGAFRMAPGSGKGQIFLGFAPLDESERLILMAHVFSLPGTDTVLSATAKNGDQIIRVKDASKWSAGKIPAFDTETDFMDLPNRNVILAGVGKIEKKGTDYEITLNQPLQKPYSKGTGVRLHGNGGFMFTGGAWPLDHQWKTPYGDAAGILKNGVSQTQWWPGTKFAKVALIIRCDKNDVMELKNITVEEITQKQ